MERLKRRFRDESVSVYTISGDPCDTLKQYVVSTRDTRDLMNYPEIVSVGFRRKMRNGITNALKGISRLEDLSRLDSRKVNVFHILRGALNFEIVSALNRAFGYKWQSSSYISSQRVLKEGSFEVSDDLYRKFVVPDEATIYSCDIVASGISLDNALRYLDAYMESSDCRIRNLVFITIGCGEAARVLRKWDKIFREKCPGYERTILCYLEGRFALASDDTPLENFSPDTDLLKSSRLGALISPEFEYSQFEKMIIALEACVIYDGGKKGFEPLNHINEILEFWERQLESARKKNISLWEEYNLRFPLEDYFEDIENLSPGSSGILMEKKKNLWRGVSSKEYAELYGKFKWLWEDPRIQGALRAGSLAGVCEKKIKYLRSLYREGSF